MLATSAAKVASWRKARDRASLNSCPFYERSGCCCADAFPSSTSSLHLWCFSFAASSSFSPLASLSSAVGTLWCGNVLRRTTQRYSKTNHRTRWCTRRRMESQLKCLLLAKDPSWCSLPYWLTTGHHHLCRHILCRFFGALLPNLLAYHRYGALACTGKCARALLIVPWFRVQIN